jgi:RNA polymerase sigma-70 factor (ECF subfamily)
MKMEISSLALRQISGISIPLASSLRKTESEVISDEEIILRVVDGNIEAFGLLVRKYENFVFTLVRGLVFSDEPAKDICQETFLRAYKALRRFENNSTFKTWLYRIAYNTALNYIKKYKLYNEQEIDEANYHGGNSEDIPLRMTLRKLIDRLKPEQKAIIMMHYFDELKYEEISEVLQCPVGTVKIRLFRAKHELKALWDKYAT